jgi:hypothetical protein
VRHKKKTHILKLVIVFLCFSKPVMAGYWYDYPMAQSPKQLIILVQKRLIELGFSPGTPDGNWGKKTYTAYGEFSKASRLSFDIKNANKISVRKVLTKDHIKALWNLDFDLNNSPGGEDHIYFLKKIGLQLY